MVLETERTLRPWFEAFERGDVEPARGHYHVRDGRITELWLHEEPPLDGQ